jgi:hypothetical protein
VSVRYRGTARSLAIGAISLAVGCATAKGV